MMNYSDSRNRAKLVGKIEAPFRYGYEADNKVFYISTLLVQRTSGTFDRVPLCITEDKLNQLHFDLYSGKVFIEGFIISYRNEYGNLKMKVRINNIFSREESAEDLNVVSLTGDLTNTPVIRNTPLGRKIADMGILTRAGGWMKFYVPAICWGWLADAAENFTKGTRVSIKARFQSREYEKKFEDGTVEQRETVELSVYRCYKV